MADIIAEGDLALIFRAQIHTADNTHPSAVLNKGIQTVGDVAQDGRVEISDSAAVFNTLLHAGNIEFFDQIVFPAPVSVLE